MFDCVSIQNFSAGGIFGVNTDTKFIEPFLEKVLCMIRQVSFI